MAAPFSGGTVGNTKHANTTKENTMAAKNTTAADVIAKDVASLKASIKALHEHSEVEGAVTKENVREFANLVDDLIAELRALKEPHRRALAVVASQASREARKVRIAKALELLEAQEAAEEEVPVA